jgi:hypothetical protein
MPTRRGTLRDPCWRKGQSHPPWPALDFAPDATTRPARDACGTALTATHGTPDDHAVVDDPDHFELCYREHNASDAAGTTDDARGAALALAERAAGQHAARDAAESDGRWAAADHAAEQSAVAALTAGDGRIWSGLRDGSPLSLWRAAARSARSRRWCRGIIGDAHVPTVTDRCYRRLIIDV